MSLAISTLLIGAALSFFGRAGAASVPSACALLGPPDFHAAFGGTVSGGDLTSSPDGQESICEWDVKVATGTSFAVQLDVKSPFSKKMFQEQRKIASGPTRHVNHLGESAFFERTTLAGQTYDDLWVHTANLAFRLEALKKVGPGPLATLSGTVVTRLSGLSG